MSTAEDIVSFNKGNFDAALQSGRIMVDGLQELSRQAAAAAQARLDEILSNARAVSGVRSTRDFFDLQLNIGRATAERALAEAGKMTEAWLKLTEQVAAPIAHRVTQAFDKASVPA